MMNQGFLNQNETILVQNNHYDEVLNISNDDSDNVSIAENSDHSPTRHTYSDGNDSEDNKHMIHLKEKYNSKPTDGSYDENSGENGRSTSNDELVEIHNNNHNNNTNIAAGMNISAAEADKNDVKHIIQGESKSAELDHEKVVVGVGDEGEHESIFPPEIVELYSCIDEYKPEVIPIEPKLKCFIPPYIPAIGNVDPFLKVPRPDKVPDGLGLTVIDEPATKQSDAAVLELQLQKQMKQKMRGTAPNVASSQFRSIENASKKQYEIDKWIDSVVDVRSSRPLVCDVQYKGSSKMPSIDEIIMQPFPKELQNELEAMMEESSSTILNPQIDLTIEEYAKVICALFDVPVVEGHLIQSLHFLFNLCIEFQKDHENNDTISLL